MSSTLRKIDACLATLGTDAFAPAYVDYVATLGIDQIMVFSLDNDRARCLLSYHFSNAALAGKLAAAYLDGWFLRDPLRPPSKRPSGTACSCRPSMTLRATWTTSTAARSSKRPVSRRRRPFSRSASACACSSASIHPPAQPTAATLIFHGSRDASP
ncbi:MAG: hypothetical protein R3D59_04550 [Paracoccaceae bacterium]